MDVTNVGVDNGPEAFFGMADALRAHGVTQGNVYLLTDDDRLLHVELITGLGYTNDGKTSVDTIIVGGREADATDLVEAIAVKLPDSASKIRDRFTNYLARYMRDQVKELLDKLRSTKKNADKIRKNNPVTADPMVDFLIRRITEGSREEFFKEYKTKEERIAFMEKHGELCSSCFYAGECELINEIDPEPKSGKVK